MGEEVTGANRGTIEGGYRSPEDRRLRVNVHPVTQMVEIAETDRPAHLIEVEWWELDALIAELQAMRRVGVGMGKLERHTPR